MYQYKGTLLFLFPVGICYIRVNTKVVYSSFQSENCKYLIDLEEQIHSQAKYFLTVQKMCKQGLTLRLVLRPHFLLYIMIVFFKIQACSIARKCLWNPSLCDCNCAVFSTSFSIQVWFFSTWCSGFIDVYGSWDVELCGCGIPDGSASLKWMYSKFFGHFK